MVGEELVRQIEDEMLEAPPCRERVITVVVSTYGHELLTAAGTSLNRKRKKPLPCVCFWGCEVRIDPALQGTDFRILRRRKIDPFNPALINPA